MSVWAEHHVEARVLEILAEVPMNSDYHQFGRPFMTAYQLAIEMHSRYPDVARSLGYPVGGAGTGRRNSLAQYLAGELSRRIGADHDYPVEGRFISNVRLRSLEYEGPDGEPIASTLTGTGFDLSMFRSRA